MATVSPRNGRAAIDGATAGSCGGTTGRRWLRESGTADREDPSPATEHVGAAALRTLGEPAERRVVEGDPLVAPVRGRESTVVADCTGLGSGFPCHATS